MPPKKAKVGGKPFTSSASQEIPRKSYSKPIGVKTVKKPQQILHTSGRTQHVLHPAVPFRPQTLRPPARQQPRKSFQDVPPGEHGQGSAAKESDSARAPDPVTEKRKAAAQERMLARLAKAEQTITLQDILDKTFKIDGYSRTAGPSDAELEKAVAFKTTVEQRRGDTRVNRGLPEVLVKEMWHLLGRLEMWMNPFMHDDRYSSYGRHFTKGHLLDIVVARILPFIRSGDSIVDFSCGSNDWVWKAVEAARGDGLVITPRSYDLFPPQGRMEGFSMKSFFDVDPRSKELPTGSDLIIGLNSPFGKNNRLANKFVAHAAEFRPRIIVLIVPPSTDMPRDHICIHEDMSIMKGKGFYIPGQKDAASGGDQFSWNKVPPALRILVRRSLASQVNMMGESL